MYKCKICNQEFSSKVKLGGHVTSQHLDLTWKTIKVEKICPKCGAKFEVMRSINNKTSIAQIREKENKFCGRACANSHPQTEQEIVFTGPNDLNNHFNKKINESISKIEKHLEKYW